MPNADFSFPSDDLLTAYLAGEATVDEQQAVEQWLALESSHGQYLEHMRTAWRLAERPHLPGDPVQAARRFRSALDTESAASLSRRTSKPMSVKAPRRRVFWLGGFAAAMAIVFAIGISAGLDPLAWFNRSSGPLSYTTKRAEQLTVKLPDGSHAVLAPATTLSFATTSRNERVVTLDGQAYFTVTHDPARPFTVLAAHTETRVLGTSFVVRAYEDDRALQVAVTEGKVAVGRKDSATVLLPGDVGRFVNGIMAVTHDVTVADVFGWMRGQLSFDGVPLRDVVRELERTYDLDITLATEALAAQPVTMTFTSKSATEVLEMLTFITNTTYTAKGRDIRLMPR